MHAMPPPLRREVLQEALLDTVDLLRRRRAGDIEAGYIDDYVALDWLEWNGGSLRLTTVGDNMCKRIRVGRPTPPDVAEPH